MPFSLDPEVRAVFAALAASRPQIPVPPVGDVDARRAFYTAALAQTAAAGVPDDVVMQDFEATAADGTPILLRWYTKQGATPGCAVYYMHGGGMILGSVELYDAVVARYVSATGVPFLSVDYRLAPEFPHPVPVEDCLAGLTWCAEQAAELGVDPARISIMGDSGGGGLAAALAILARDRGGPAIEKQILIYPMLDDRTTTPDPELAPFAFWSYDDNATGWGALLGQAMGGPDVSAHAAPARVADPAGLPPAFLEVGELDIFRDETVTYAHRLAAAGVSAELHVHPGVPHGFEIAAFETDVARRVVAERERILRSLL